jgi:hypothetical protein
MTVEELDALSAKIPPAASISPQPKGHWRNGKFVISE